MGTGGMRSGAGRPAHKVKGEYLMRLDVRDLARRGLLRLGWFTWRWTRDGKESGSIGIHVNAGDVIQLQYTFGKDDDRRDASQTVGLLRTGCAYGGSRPWFRCPVCARRIAMLYMRAGRFACRTCQRVAYASQSGDAIDRLWRKQAKCEARLCDNWQRPKGMRRRTYDRLIDTLVDCEVRRDLAFCAMAARMFGADTLDRIARGVH